MYVDGVDELDDGMNAEDDVDDGVVLNDWHASKRHEQGIHVTNADNHGGVALAQQTLKYTGTPTCISASGNVLAAHSTRQTHARYGICNG